MVGHFRPTGCLSQSWLSSAPLVPPWQVIFGLQGASVKADFHCCLLCPNGKSYSAYRVSQSKVTFIDSSGTPFGTTMAGNFWPTVCPNHTWTPFPPEATILWASARTMCGVFTWRSRSCVSFVKSKNCLKKMTTATTVKMNFSITRPC